MSRRVRNADCFACGKLDNLIIRELPDSVYRNIFKKMILMILSGILIAILILGVVLVIYSPGKPESFFDENGKVLPESISEKTFAVINGVKQGMFIRGKDLNNPILLYIHGGPAFPNYFLVDKYKPGLEDHFTVCYWEQRGGGLSYSKDVTPESMNMEQFVSDAIEVTHYLRDRFKKQKIYLLAHSGGTTFAIQAAARAPYLYYAYIGMAQITCQAESEKIAYKYILKEYTLNGNKKALKELKKYPVLESDDYIIPFYKSMIRDKTMHDLGIGTMRNMKSVFFDIFIPVWTCKAYTIKEKVNIWVSKFSFVKKSGLINELFETDIATVVPKLDIPVYFISGSYDLTVNVDLAKRYLEQLQSPVKAFYEFGASAHSPAYEEPERFRAIMRRIMNDE